jgi:hypothetical protein
MIDTDLTISLFGQLVAYDIRVIFVVIKNTALIWFQVMFFFIIINVYVRL